MTIIVCSAKLALFKPGRVRNEASLTLPVAGERFTETIFSKAADNNVIGEMDFWCFLVV